MKLKFIGTNGSMGLSHGAVYNVNVRTVRHFIWVEIESSENGYFRTWRCPYSSPQSFSENWESVTPHEI